MPLFFRRRLAAEGSGLDSIDGRNPILGPAVGTAAAALSAGSFVKVADATGQLQAVGGEAASTVVEVVGIALTSASAAGDTFDLAVVPFRYVA